MAATSDRKRFGVGANIRAGLIALIMMLVVMAVFLSESLQSQAYDLPPGPLSDSLVAAAEQWHAWMEHIGAAGLSATIAAEGQQLHDAQFEE
jgi:hypothetical protein